MKYCALCGGELEEGGKFCPECGADLSEFADEPKPEEPSTEEPSTEEPSAEDREDTPDADDTEYIKDPPETKPASSGSHQTLGIIAAVIAAAAVIIFAAVYFLDSSKYAFIESKPIVYGDVVSLSAGRSYTFDGGIKLMQHSTDGTKVFVLTDDDELYYCDGNQPMRIASDAESFIVSDDGSAVAYFTDIERRSGDDYATLRLYTVSNANREIIARDIPFADVDGYAGVSISPNGKIVGYISEIEYDYYELSIRSALWQNGSRESLPMNVVPCYISNNKNYLYYLRFDSDGSNASFNVDKGKDTTRLVPSIDRYTEVTFAAYNRDYSQVLFSFDGRTFISKNGGERERIASVVFTAPLLPAGAQYTDGSDLYELGEGGYHIGVSDFADTCFYAEGGIYRIDKDNEARRVISSYDKVYLAKDGDTIFFTVNNRLYKIDASDPNAERTEITDERVRDFAVSADGKDVYYLTDYRELYHIKSNGNKTAIRSDERITALTVPGGGNTLYFVDDGMLYTSERGAARARVPAPDSDAIDEFRTLEDGGMLYRSGGSVYRSDGGKEFRLILSVYPESAAPSLRTVR